MGTLPSMSIGQGQRSWCVVLYGCDGVEILGRGGDAT